MKTARIFISYIINTISILVPTNSKMIVFESGRGRADDNPRALFDFILENQLDYTVYFVVTNDLMHDDIDSKHKIINNSIHYFYVMMRSKFWVRSQSVGSLVKKKSNQVYFQLWHGSQFKKMGLDIDDQDGDIKQLEHTLEWDIYVGNNTEEESIVRSQTGFNKSFKACGMARVDRLVHEKNTPKRKEILEQLNLSHDYRYILYAPTFRDWDLNSELITNEEVKKLIKSLPDDTKILARYHPIIANKVDDSCFNDKFINVSEINNLQDLLLIAHCLITDYSSIFYDYAVLDRPIIFYTHDIIKYTSIRGGFYYSFEKDLPGIVAQNEEVLINHVLDVLFDKNQNIAIQKRSEFSLGLNRFNDGKVCERLIDLINSY